MTTSMSMTATSLPHTHTVTYTYLVVYVLEVCPPAKLLWPIHLPGGICP